MYKYFLLAIAISPFTSLSQTGSSFSQENVTTWQQVISNLSAMIAVLNQAQTRGIDKDQGMESISFNPDSILKGIENIRQAEQKLSLQE